MRVASRFSPELLGVQASSALVWLIMEVLAVLLSLYLVTVNTDLTTIDLLAFSGYKYVGWVQRPSVQPLPVMAVRSFFSRARLIGGSSSLFRLQDDHRRRSGTGVREAGLLPLPAVVLRCHLCLHGEWLLHYKLNMSSANAHNRLSAEADGVQQAQITAALSN